VGSAWWFRHDGTSWTGEPVAAPADISAAGQFGATVALDGGLALVAVPADTVGSFAVQGSTCVVKTQPAGWTWIGGALAGVEGAPDLVGTGLLEAGTGVKLVIDDAQPRSIVTLCISTVQLSLPFKGGVLVPAPDIVVTGLPTDLDGVLPLAGLWPVGVPAGVPILYQAWVLDDAAPQGLSATNAISSTAP
jgi:hypothetical protein